MVHPYVLQFVEYMLESRWPNANSASGQNTIHVITITTLGDAVDFGDTCIQSGEAGVLAHALVELSWVESSVDLM